MAKDSRIPEKALSALNDAALAIAAEVSLDKVLQQITNSARELAGARYAALGVPDSEGHLENSLPAAFLLKKKPEFPTDPVV